LPDTVTGMLVASFEHSVLRAKPTTDNRGASQLFEADKSSEQSLAAGGGLRVSYKDLSQASDRTNTQSANGVQTSLGDTRIHTQILEFVGMDRLNLSTSQIIQSLLNTKINNQTEKTNEPTVNKLSLREPLAKFLPVERLKINMLSVSKILNLDSYCIYRGIAICSPSSDSSNGRR
jgi:hypothetical protein